MRLAAHIASGSLVAGSLCIANLDLTRAVAGLARGPRTPSRDFPLLPFPESSAVNMPPKADSNEVKIGEHEIQSYLDRRTGFDGVELPSPLAVAFWWPRPLYRCWTLDYAGNTSEHVVLERSDENVRAEAHAECHFLLSFPRTSATFVPIIYRQKLNFNVK